ncbi:MAG TPA: PKD domain-containing protein, partial [Bacteroidia bacterium]|nr:PKD domain-containing protein [Bacteroidia bacterium]
MKKIIFILFAISILKANAQTWVTVTDPIFASYLRSIIPAAMHNDSLNTGSTLVTTSTKKIIVFNTGVSNIDAVQYFTSLDTLACSDNHLTHLPSLPSTLLFLNCAANSLTALPALPPSLVFLDCQINYITLIPTLPNTLTYFNCIVNSLSALPALPNTLTTIYCSHNSITTMPTLPTHLYDFDCGFNKLTALPTLPNSLHSFGCENNNISCFPNLPDSLGYDSSHQLYRVDLYNNPFTCLPNYAQNLPADIMAYPLCSTGNSNNCNVVAADCAANFTYTIIGAQVNFFAPSTTTNYTWHFGDSFSDSIAVGLTAQHYYHNGTYTAQCVANDGNGHITCLSTQTITVTNSTLGISAYNTQNISVKTYPNPAQNKITIDVNNLVD